MLNDIYRCENIYYDWQRTSSTTSTTYTTTEIPPAFPGVGGGGDVGGAAGTTTAGTPGPTTTSTTTTLDPALQEKMDSMGYIFGWIGSLLGWGTSLLSPFELNVWGGLVGSLVGADVGVYNDQLQKAQSFVQVPASEGPP